MAKKVDYEYKYYTLDRIKSKNCKYNIIFGERSNGKTYACKKEMLDEVKKGNKFAYIRRNDIDIKGANATSYFTDIVRNGYVSKLHIKIPNDPEAREFNDITYRSQRFYLSYYDYEKQKLLLDEEPCGYCFTISTYVHSKSLSFPNTTIAVFDEFITRDGYFTDEFVHFQNIISTLVREKAILTIYMLGNTVNQFCPYFSEMGLKHIKQMKKGDIDVYEYGESGLKVAVEYAEGICKEGKESDVYFAFDNDKMKMITQGDWELEIYPHLPEKYNEKEVKLTFFIEFFDEILQCEVVKKSGYIFTYIHRKTTPIKDKQKDIVFSTYDCVYPKSNKNFLKPTSPIHKKIKSLVTIDNMFYQDNECGEVMRNYLLWCMDN